MMIQSPSKVTQEILQKCLVWKTNEQLTLQEIRQRLIDDFNLEVSIGTLSKRLKSERKIRSEIARNIYTEEIRENAFSDARALTDLAKAYANDWSKYRKSGEFKKEIECAKMLLGVIKQKTDILGVNDNAADLLDHTKQDQLDFIDKLKAMIPAPITEASFFLKEEDCNVYEASSDGEFEEEENCAS